ASGTAQRAQAGEVGYGTIQQGYLETSNVNAVTEISSLITAQRAYEMNSKVITTTDEMLRTTSNLR
ncbi:MAG: flagellar basal body rod C-terminal domain-containing protein, partial [Hyphomonadaceae bacterium]